jgi:alkylation response protein AidB-like acyl-CoA dehydrogenase
VDFTFSEEQTMFVQVVDQVLADHCAGSDLRRMLTQGLARDPRRWAALAETGVAGVLAPEAAGGLGLAETDLVLIAQACGRAALPEPLIEHAGIAVPLLAAAGEASGRLAAAIAGAATLAVGHPINPFIADADSADLLLLHHEGEIHGLARPAVSLTRQQSVDPFRRLYTVAWTPSPGSRLVAAAAGRALWDDALDRGALFAAAQLLGLAQRCVDLSVEYAKTRQQFGKPIGAYQAVKHLLADVQVQVEFAAPVVYAAAAGLAARDVFSRARISHAKLVAGQACDLAARTAVQVHGAMGFSWEVDVHFLLKRGLALNESWGGPAFHRRRVEQRVFNRPLGPDQTFATEAAHG